MICARLTGGLGNQLFQYAMGRRLALHHNTELVLDTTGYGQNGENRPKEFVHFKRPLVLYNFKVQARDATPDELRRVKDDFYRATARDRIVRRLRRIWPRLLWNDSHHIERAYRFQADALEYPDNVYVQGYWQSPKYFCDVACQIREEFKLKDESITASARSAVGALRQTYGEVVSLHVRRGDIAHAHETLGRGLMVHGAPVTTDYIQAAIAKFPQATCFLVFSDSPSDIEWCRRNIQADRLHFSSATSDLWDFVAMGMCDHHIISNSTFSWWAAWLNASPGRRVISPGHWSSPQAKVEMATDDLIPPDWEMI